MKAEKFEIFDSDIPDYRIDELKRNTKPVAFNGYVNIKKYRITIEPILEPQETYIQRLIELYNKEDNWHVKEDIDNYATNNFGLRIYDMINREKLDTIKKKKEALIRAINNIRENVKLSLKYFGLKEDYKYLYFNTCEDGYSWVIGRRVTPIFPMRSNNYIKTFKTLAGAKRNLIKYINNAKWLFKED